MPITRSAKKALRQNRKRKAQNLIKKEAIRKTRKQTIAAATAGNEQEAKIALAAAYKAIDKAAKTKYIKKNKAARLKSRLAKKLNKYFS